MNRSNLPIFIFYIFVIVITGCDLYVEKDFVPPLVSIISPVDNEQITLPEEITVSARDNEEVDSVFILIDGISRIMENSVSDTYSYTWQVKEFSNPGIHTLLAVALDNSGNVDSTNYIAVIIGQLYSGQVTVLIEGVEVEIVTNTGTEYFFKIDVLSGIKKLEYEINSDISWNGWLRRNDYPDNTQYDKVWLNNPPGNTKIEVKPDNGENELQPGTYYLRITVIEGGNFKIKAYFKK
jgi:hypothetical protein